MNDLTKREEGDKKNNVLTVLSTLLQRRVRPSLSSMPVARAFSVMECAPIQRQRVARVGKGDSWYDDRTIVL